MRKVTSTLLAIFVICFSISAQTTFTVTNTDTAGVGSLKQAILDANSNAGADIIDFNIPGDGPHTLFPMVDFTTITEAVSILGYSQPGSAKATANSEAIIKIELDGSTGGNHNIGIDIIADNCKVEGVAVNNFGRDGIGIKGKNNIIQGCYVGVSLDGTQSLGNGLRDEEFWYDGIWIDEASNTLIGGSNPGDRNLIAGSGYSNIYITGKLAKGNKIIRNYIGLNASGTDTLSGINDVGIFIGQSATENIIGGSIENEGNVISKSYVAGILIENSDNNIITGNLIGTDKTGTKELGNLRKGIEVKFSSSNTIGSTDPNKRNIISGNGWDGISVTGRTATKNKIIGNYIGVSKDGKTIIPNSFAGVGIYSGSENIVGGTEQGEGNIIAGNILEGVFIREAFSVNNITAITKNDKKGNTLKKNRRKSSLVKNTKSKNKSSLRTNSVTVIGDSAQFNSVLGNSIYANGTLGIDLDKVGRSNDVGDFDKGVNGSQNYPVISSVTGDGTNATIDYSISSTDPNSSYPIRVEFFVADANEQGKTFIGADTYTNAEATKSKSFIFAPSISIGTSELIVATATDANGNTSEFSDAFETNSVVGVEEKTTIPNEFLLSQNYPNPFNPTTVITYNIPFSRGANGVSKNSLSAYGLVTLKIYDTLGKEVVTLVNKEQPSGNYTVNFDASKLSNGVYMYKLTSSNFVDVKKMILLK